MEKVIRMMAPAADVPCDVPVGAYLKSYEDTPCGRGKVVFTTKAPEAMLFTSAREAITYYQTQSEAVPLRPDGKPNRPLTAFTVSIEDRPS